MPLQSDKVSLAWDQFLQPSIQKFTIDVAEQTLKEEVARHGFDQNPVVITDGQLRRDYRLVKPFGRIEFVNLRGNLQGAVTWILAQLLLLAPIGRGPDRRPGHPGFYKGHFMVLQDGTELADLAQLRPGRIVQIVNIAAYAAKIEGQDAYTRWKGLKGSGTRRRQRRSSGRSAKQLRGESRQAPQGVFNVIFPQARLRYGKSLDISYGPVQLNLGVTVTGLQGGRHILKRRRIARPQVYPAIRIYQRPDPSLN
jgi:hypothetical protein